VKKQPAKEKERVRQKENVRLQHAFFFSSRRRAEAVERAKKQEKVFLSL